VIYSTYYLDTSALKAYTPIDDSACLSPNLPHIASSQRLSVDRWSGMYVGLRQRHYRRGAKGTKPNSNCWSVLSSSESRLLLESEEFFDRHG